MLRPSRLYMLALCALTLGCSTAVPVVANEPAAPSAAVAAAFQPFEGAVPASKVTEASLGKEVVVVGQVQEAVPSGGERVPTRLTLSAASGKTFMVVYWPDVAPIVEGGQGLPKEGTAVSAKGTVEAFRDTLQIKVKEASQIRIAGVTQGAAAPVAAQAPDVPKAATPSGPAAVRPAVAAAPTPAPDADGYYAPEQIASLKPAFLNKEISIKATITEFTPARNDRAPNVILVGSGDAKSEVVYWSEDKTTYSKPGLQIYATGLLQEYKDRTQIKIADFDHISTQPLAPEFMAKEIVFPPPATGPADHWPGANKASGAPELKPIAVPAGTALKLNQISSAHEGNTIKVAGKVFAVSAGDGGTQSVILSADGAMLTVILPADAAKPEKDSPFEATGQLVYNKLRAQPELIVRPAK